MQIILFNHDFETDFHARSENAETAIILQDLTYFPPNYIVNTQLTD